MSNSTLEEIEKQYKLPLSIETEFPQVTNSILSLSWSNAGYRLLTGSSDANLRIYDFNGMTEAHRPYKEVEFTSHQPVNSISQSSDSKFIFLSTESSKPIFCTNDGKVKVNCIEGDPYIFDNVKTVGHQTVVRQVCYNPVDSTKALSCSLDCTGRIWDINGKTSFDELESLEAIRVKNRKGFKTPVTSCCYSSDARQIYFGTKEGTIQMFDSKNRYIRPQRSIYDAHIDEILSLVFDSSNTLLASRSKDNSVKVWDTRKLVKPIKVYTNIPTTQDTSNLSFGPQSGLFVVGTSYVPELQSTGDLWFYNINNNENLDPIYKYTVCDDSSVVCVSWHSKYNQIVIGCQNGETLGYYDPEISIKGFITTDSRKDTRREELTFGDLSKAAWNVDDTETLTDKDFKQAYNSMIHPSTRYSKPETSADLDKGPNPLVSLSNQNFGTDFIKDVMEDPREALLKQSQKEDDAITRHLKALFSKNDPKHQLAKRTLEEDLYDQEMIYRKRQGRS